MAIGLEHVNKKRLVENHETGLFESRRGKRFIKCEFNPNAPVYIDITSDCWSAQYAGSFFKLDWPALALPDEIATPVKSVAIEKLNTHAPRYLGHLETALKSLKKAASWTELTEGLGSLSSASWLRIWASMTARDCSTIRSIYSDLADRNLGGASQAISIEMKSWKARAKIVHLRHVLGWDPEKGAYSSAEVKVILDLLKRRPEGETTKDLCLRLYAWIMFETLKRPIQVLSMERDALQEVQDPTSARSEYFLRIPKAKGQSGQPSELWQITEALGREIQAFLRRPTVASQSRTRNRLLITGLEVYEQIDLSTAYNELATWSINQEVLSPRTKRRIKLSGRRIRHTGCTGMALQGADRGAIQSVCEHDSPFSANAYIDCVGADLIPLFERTDRGIGAIFSGLSNSFFKGAIVDHVGPRPIIIPIASATPAVVGSCGKGGPCKKHPFWQCYNGCPAFLAWREADHRRSLEFLTNESNRWGAAEGGKQRSKLAKDFDGTAAGVIEVIKQIEQSNAEHGRQI